MGRTTGSRTTIWNKSLVEYQRNGWIIFSDEYVQYPTPPKVEGWFYAQYRVKVILLLLVTGPEE